MAITLGRMGRKMEIWSFLLGQGWGQGSPGYAAESSFSNVILESEGLRRGSSGLTIPGRAQSPAYILRFFLTASSKVQGSLRRPKEAHMLLEQPGWVSQGSPFK
jgi:hypothetical protein